jgi:hypothetical protein
VRELSAFEDQQVEFKAGVVVQGVFINTYDEILGNS